MSAVVHCSLQPCTSVWFPIISSYPLPCIFVICYMPRLDTITRFKNLNGGLQAVFLYIILYFGLHARSSSSFSISLKVAHVSTLAVFVELSFSNLAFPTPPLLFPPFRSLLSASSTDLSIIISVSWSQNVITSPARQHLRYFKPTAAKTNLAH